MCVGPLPSDARGNTQYCSKRCKYRAQNVSTYGLTPEAFRELIASGRCPICDRNVKKWHIDHRHSDGLTFGAVCFSCNAFLLAGSRHDLKIARRLVAFLEDPPATTAGELGEKYVLPTRQSRTTASKRRGQRLTFGPAKEDLNAA